MHAFGFNNVNFVPFYIQEKQRQLNLNIKNNLKNNNLIGSSRKANVPDFKSYPANTKHLYNTCTTSAQRLRRWSNIVQMLYNCLVFPGSIVFWLRPVHVEVQPTADCEWKRDGW